MNKVFSLSVVIVGFLLASAIGVAQSPSNVAQPDSQRRIPDFLIGVPGKDKQRALRELTEQSDQWAELRRRCGNLLVADHSLDREFRDDAELTALLGKIRAMNLPLQLEVGAVKQWGKTGQECFDRQQPKWERFLRCGGVIDSIAMDEPLVCTQVHLKMGDDAMEHALEETVKFVGLVRRAYPHWMVGDIEGFPGLPLDDLIRWIDQLEARLKADHGRGLDFFRLDVDWMHFVHNTGKGRWSDIKRVENHCRSKNIPFSIVYWASNYPAMLKKELADDVTWYVGAIQMGFNYAAVGGTPDQIVVQSWVAGPPTILPETAPFSFTRSALDIVNRFRPEKK